MDDLHTTDVSLLGRIAQRDPQALEAFYVRYARPVFSLALAMLGDRTRAADLTHEVFLLVWRHAGVYQPSGSARAWVLRLTRNRAIDELQQDQRRPQATLLSRDDDWSALPRVCDGGGGSAASSGLFHFRPTPGQRRPFPAPPEQADTVERQAIRAAIAALPAEQREALLLAFLHGLSHQAIATRLQTPLGTIKARIHRALQTLHKQFQEGGAL